MIIRIISLLILTSIAVFGQSLEFKNPELSMENVYVAASTLEQSAKFISVKYNEPSLFTWQYRFSTMAGLGMGYATCLAVNPKEGETKTVLWSYLGGYTVGSTLGVYLISKLKGHNGSLTATFLGSTVGLGVGTLLFHNNENNVFGIAALVQIMFTFATTTAGSIIGYNLSDKIKVENDDDTWGMLNIEKDKICLGIPKIMIDNEQTFFKLNNNTLSINLITAHF